MRPRLWCKWSPECQEFGLPPALPTDIGPIDRAICGFYLILLDEATRTVQVAVIHPDNVPDALTSLLPALPTELSRPFIDGLVQLRLPEGV
jgi:hypothetical protein